MESIGQFSSDVFVDMYLFLVVAPRRSRPSAFWLVLMMPV